MHHMHWNQEHSIPEEGMGDSDKEVLVVPVEQDERLDMENIPHEKGVEYVHIPEEHNHYYKEVHHMHPSVEFEVGCGHNNCGYGHGGFGGALAGGLIGSAIGNRGFGNWGGYGAGYGGYGFNNNISTGDMFGAMETNKIGHQMARDVFTSGHDITTKQLVGDHALAHRIAEADTRSQLGHAMLAKDICDVKTSLGQEILESRHLNAIEHCKTRELTLKETGAILAKMACDREQELRDELLLERCRRDKAEGNIVNAQIINQLGSLNTAIAGLLDGSTK